jgi:hypothetical protein
MERKTSENCSSIHSQSNLHKHVRKPPWAKERKLNRLEMMMSDPSIGTQIAPLSSIKSGKNPDSWYKKYIEMFHLVSKI